MKKIFLITYLLVIVLGCCKIPTKYNVWFVNNAEYGIVPYLLFAGEHIYPDTLFIYKPTGVIEPRSHTYTDISAPLETMIQRTLKDTLSFFYFHADTLNKYPLEILQQDYKILQRYDLSSNDVRVLKNQYGIPEIPYPPTETMRNMKMYPPYEE
jgi:hypothetical protein